jgi:hypothetical protein
MILLIGVPLAVAVIAGLAASETRADIAKVQGLPAGATHSATVRRGLVSLAKWQYKRAGWELQGKSGNGLPKSKTLITLVRNS